jgi:hypothetical protein
MKSKLFQWTFIVLASFTSAFSYSQSLYEIKFSDEAGNQYTGFMVYFNESESYIRMAYYSGEEYRVVHTDYAATTGVEGEYSYFFMGGYQSRFITESGGETYNPDYFIWIWNDETPMDLPYTTDDPEFKAETFRKVDSYREIDANELTSTYLNQFYSTDEADYLAFLSMTTDASDNTIDNTSYNENDYTDNSNIGYETTNDQSTNTNNQNTNSTFDDVTFHFIVVANTEIGDIGASCEVDKRNLLSEFEGVAEAMGIKYKPYVVDGKNFTKTSVSKVLKDLTPGKNDIVFFVYTGHGFRWSDQSDTYPRMDLRYNSYQKIENATSMGLSEVYAAIKEKGARLNIVFGDCCNADVGVNSRTSSSFLANRSNPNFKAQKLQKLFINSRGNLIATAASPGEVSWSNSVNGGFFIWSFLQAFHEEISIVSNDEADWDGLIKNTIDQAKYKTSRNSCGTCSTQNGVSAIKVSY